MVPIRGAGFPPRRAVHDLNRRQAMPSAQRPPDCSDFELRGDQVHAVPEIVEGLNRGDKHQVLLGVTGSGKTYHDGAGHRRVNRPTLVMAHNKTLAAQLYQEFRRFFPTTPSSTSSATTTITSPKPTSPPATPTSRKNRSSTTRSTACGCRPRGRSSSAATSSSSPACPASTVSARQRRIRHAAAARARAADGSRSDPPQAGRDPVRAQRPRVRARTFRVRGDIVEVYPSLRRGGAADRAVRRRDRRAGVVRSAHRQSVPAARSRGGLSQVTLRHLAQRLKTRSRRSRPNSSSGGRQLESEGKLLEAQRLHQRTMFDLEMIREIGYCHGIENYSRHLTGRRPGEPPPTLLDYCPPTRSSSSTRATRPCRRCAACTRATDRARKCSSTTGSACRPRSTTGR